MAEGSNKRILILHMISSTIMGTLFALAAILPFLARERFGASNWQTTVLTAAIPVMQFFSIFWNHVYARVPIGVYLAAFGGMVCVPLGLAGLASNIWILMGCYVLAAFGSAALSPLSADVLRTCYASEVRGRSYGMVAAAQMFVAMTAGQMMGTWSDHDENAYRIFLPLLAGVQLVGVLSFAWIARQRIFRERSRPAIATTRSWTAPLRDMTTVLRDNRRFRTYEIAFMLYGVGWMICTALLPVVGTDRLGLSYSQYAAATVVVFQLTNVVMFAPVGRLADRIGPVRLAAGSFLWLTIYPIGLMFVPHAVGLGLLSLLFALGMVGVQLTWTLGPVSLAGDAVKAPHYLAIHTTMVGVRGLLFQGLGIALYAYTGGFVAPLAVAALGFLAASRHMRKLS